MTQVPFPLNILIYIAKLPIMLIVIWLFYILIEYAWSGLANVVNIVLFPGYLLRRTTQSFVAKLLGVSPRVYALQGPRRAGARMYVQLKDPFMASILAVCPAFTAIPFYLLAIALFDMSTSVYAKMVAAWLAVSIFITGFPNFGDLGFIAVSIIAHKPLLQVFLIWSVVIFIISLNAFDLIISTAITLSYIFLIILANASVGEKRETPVIVNED